MTAKKSSASSQYFAVFFAVLVGFLSYFLFELKWYWSLGLAFLVIIMLEDSKNKNDPTKEERVCYLLGILAGILSYRLFQLKWYWCVGIGIVVTLIFLLYCEIKKEKEINFHSSKKEPSKKNFNLEDYMDSRELEGHWQQREAVALYMKGKYTAANSKIDRALELFEKSGPHSQGKAVCLLTKGDFCLRSGDFVNALSLFNQSHAILISAKDNILTENTKKSRAGELAAQRCLTVIDKIIAKVSIKTGMTQRELGNLEQAFHFLQEGLAVSNNSHELPDAAEALAELGKTFAVSGRLDEAAAYYGQSLKINEETANIQGIQCCRQSLRNIEQAMAPGALGERLSHIGPGVIPADQQKMIGLIKKAAGNLASGEGWSRTPYDGIFSPASPSGVQIHHQEKIFDFFVSYKSEDVAIARQIADLLTAAGYRVWFAEYTILLAERKRFEEMIGEGLRSSRYGIILTGNGYFQSHWCILELENLLKPGNCGNQRIFHVILQREPLLFRNYPELKTKHTIDYKGNPMEVIEFIRRSTGQPIRFPAPLNTKAVGPRIYHEKELNYSLDLADWVLTKDGEVETPYGKMGPVCRCDFNGYRATWNVVVGTPAPALRKIPMAGKYVDDRKCFDQIIEVARWILGNLDVDCRGVHLLFSGGFTQIALTYWCHGYWTRRYSVVLPDPKTGITTEFAFTFAFFGPFQNYCLHAHHMDRVVQSLQWPARNT